VIVNSSSLDDKVLFKSDGMPTYHLANIVDDYLMQITHVIRGEEWLPSAPLHYLLYRFFGWEDVRPQFAHLPLILRPDGNGKLSKRDGDRLGFPVFPLNWKDPESGEWTVGFREKGFFPDAFANMLALLGWAPHSTKELLSLEEMVEEFSIDRIHKGGARFDFEKAKWFNHEYMKRKSGRELAPYIETELAERKITASTDYILKVVEVIKQRCTFTTELWLHASFFFEDPTVYDESVVKSKWHEEANKKIGLLIGALEQQEDFDSKAIDTFLHDFLEKNKFKAGDVLPLLRVMFIGAKKRSGGLRDHFRTGKGKVAGKNRQGHIKF
jgi:glutamyl-tRNA synthetase